VEEKTGSGVRRHNEGARLASPDSPARARWRIETVLLLALPAILLLLVFFIGPLIVNFQESLRLEQSFPSFHHYSKFFGDQYYLMVLGHTVLFGVGVTILCLLFGYPFAYALAETQGRWKAVLLFIVVAPLLTNVVVRSYGWMIVLGGTGLVNTVLGRLGADPLDLMYTWTAVTIAMTHVLLPFAVLSIASVLDGRDRALEEVALTLGASPARVFREIILPMSLEGVVTAAILVFTLSVGSFVTVLLLGKTSTMTVAVLIYQQLTVVSNWGFGAAMGIILLALVLVILALHARLRARST
jgi:ABC-type spermidine/putrescine transport system permease subunit I